MAFSPVITAETHCSASQHQAHLANTHCSASLIPRPIPPTVFDRLQYARNTRDGSTWNGNNYCRAPPPVCQPSVSWLLMLPFLPEWINGSSECLQEGTNSTFEDSPKCWSKHECAR